MILRRVHVEGWRCFANPLELGPLDDRINVVHGPNGSGKSTLLWAMIRGLMDNHAARGETIQSLRPEGRQLAPRVTIELEHDGSRLKVFKQFLDGARSELNRFEGGRWVPFAEGRAADEVVRTMLDGSLPGSGFTKEKHWGLAQVLWAPQGNLHLSELGGGVARAIRASLGAQIASPVADGVERKITEAYSAVYTGTGKLKSGKGAPEIVRLGKELEQAESRREKLLVRVGDYDQLSRTIDELQTRREDLCRIEGPLAESLASAAAAADAYNRLKTQHAQQTADKEAAEARWRELNSRIDAIEAARKEERDLLDALKRLEDALPQRKRAVERCTADEADAAAAVEAMDGRREQVARMRRAADEAARYRVARDRRDDREKRLGQAAEFQAAVDALVERRGGLNAPDGPRLRAIQAAAVCCESARARLAAAMIGVRVEAEQDFELEVDRAEAVGGRPVTAGEAVELAGAGIVEFRIPGVARIRATGPSESIELLRGELVAAEHEFESRVEGLPTRDVSRLAALHDEATALDQKIATARAPLQGALGGNTIGQLQSERDEAARIAAAIEAEFPDWIASPPDAGALEADARRAQQQLDADREAAERRRGQCQEAKRVAETELALARRGIEDKQDRLEKVKERLAGAALSGSDSQAELQRRAMAADAARGWLNETETKLKAFDGDPNQKSREIERQLTSVREELAENLLEQSKFKGRLDGLQAESPYSALGEADEEIARLREAIAGEQLRNDATRLLHETFRDCRSRAVEAVFEPVQRRAADLLQRIMPTPLGTVCFSESFLPEHVLPEGTDRPRALEEASGGEQEQVHLAVRLALADVLYDDERQLIVLDDVLTATDPERLARILEVIQETAERYQLLIMTCHPERYRPLAAARFFDLTAIRNQDEEPRMNTDEHG